MTKLNATKGLVLCITPSTFFFPEFRKSQLDLSKTTRRYLELKTETEIKHISGEILLH